LCRVLELLLAERGVRAVTLSLDDFYLGRAARQQLAETVHPLLVTRGVPGTHDVGLLENTLDRLLSGGFCEVPRFDKSRDDRVVKTKWMEMGGADIVLLEGWCVGCIAESEAALVEPVNRLEAEEDADGSWRRYVNQRLNGEYAGLFARLDYLLMLEAPSLDAVLEWRTQQEQKLALKMPGRAVMSDAAIRRFVQHYQRITLNSLAALPARADYVLRLGEDHRPKSEWPMIGRSVDLLVAGEVLKNTP
jgi:D-glycerate 3-kinase